MSNSVKNVLVGSLVIISIAILLGLVMFLRPSVGDEKQTILIRFSDINRINIGTRVLFAGKAVGEVTAIQEIEKARETQPIDEIGQLYFYQLTLKIDSSVHIYSTDEISIKTSGLLGDKSIAIIPRIPPKGVTPNIITERTPFYAISIDPIENSFNRLSSIGEKMEATIDTINSWWIKNTPNISESIDSFDSAMKEIRLSFETINQEQFIEECKEGISTITSFFQKTDRAMSHLEEAQFFEHIGAASHKIQLAAEDISQICATIAEGKGSIGALIEKDDAYLQLNSCMSKLNSVINDINHYGILFHLNKTWQRKRTKQIAAMEKLDTAAGLKEFFEEEIEEINSGMARLSMLMEKRENSLDPMLFKKTLAELMRQVSSLYNNIRLYNEQIIEPNFESSEEENKPLFNDKGIEQ